MKNLAYMFAYLGLFWTISAVAHPKGFSTNWWLLVLGCICLAAAVQIVVNAIAADKKESEK